MTLHIKYYWEKNFFSDKCEKRGLRNFFPLDSITPYVFSGDLAMDLILLLKILWQNTSNQNKNMTVFFQSTSFVKHALFQSPPFPANISHPLNTAMFRKVDLECDMGWII